MEVFEGVQQQIQSVKSQLRKELPHLAAKADKEKQEMTELAKRLRDMDDVGLRQEVRHVAIVTGSNGVLLSSLWLLTPLSRSIQTASMEAELASMWFGSQRDAVKVAATLRSSQP